MNGLSSRTGSYLSLAKPLGYAVACVACIPFVIVAQAVGIGCLSAIGRASGYDATRVEQWVELGLCGVGVLGGLLSIWLLRKADRAFGPAVQRIDSPHPAIRESAVFVMVAASLVGKLVGPAMVLIYGLLAAFFLYRLFM